jgi:O-methyltransferase
MRTLKGVVDTVIVPMCRKVTPLGKLAHYVSQNIGVKKESYQYFKDTYDYLKTKFIQNGMQSRWNKNVRATLVERFETIDEEVQITTTPTDGLSLAEALLSLDVDGAIVECGCYTGGSTAKLSIVARMMNKKLLVFDSFEGLPRTDQHHERDYHTRRSSKWFTSWANGRYAAPLEQVKSNIEAYGEISVCSFYKGWFSDTLKEEILPQRICFAFTDVDLAQSARECFIPIWPRIPDGGLYFSHDIAYIKVLQALLDETLWKKVLNDFPPILFGAGYGLGDSSPHLGFMVKGKAITPEYIKNLAIEK